MIFFSFFLVWMSVYALGISVPGIFLTFLKSGFVRYRPRWIVPIFILTLWVIFKALYFYKSSFWLYENLKILDFSLCLLLFRFNWNFSKYYFFSSFVLLLIAFNQNLNENFSGWLIFMIWVSGYYYWSYNFQKRMLLWLMGVLTCFYLNSFTALVVIFLSPLLSKISIKKFTSIYSIGFFILIFCIYYFFNSNEAIRNLYLASGTLSIRFSLWINNLFGLSFMEFLFGSSEYLNEFISSDHANFVQSSFQYTGKSSHNLISDTILKYGALFYFFLILTIRRIPSFYNLLINSVLLYWFFEPGLGVFQLFSVMYMASFVRPSPYKAY